MLLLGDRNRELIILISLCVSVCERDLKMTMFPLVCLLCLTLTVPNLALTYRLVRNKLFGSVFNLHSVFMFLLTAVKTPLSVATKLTLITGAENFFDFSCYAKPLMEWIWGGSLLIGTVYALLFKYIKAQCQTIYKQTLYNSIQVCEGGQCSQRPGP